MRLGFLLSLAVATQGCERAGPRRQTEPAASTITSPQPASALTGRYEGLPMLVLVECYALDVIGELPPERGAKVAGIATRVFGGGSDWKATVGRELAWNRERVDAEIRANWATFR